MPLFEFWCESCSRRFTVLESDPPNSAECPHCKQQGSKRLVSRFRQGKDEDTKMNELAERFESMDEEPSDREMRSAMRDLGSALDEGDPDAVERAYEEEVE